ncbi:CDF family Co(II)/Ni(II) efflux transporter DmeF [Hyphomicrobium sp. LHD-15]|uniref:CDF family Co(II)/Ni(II) efflux transporter DmeF n=1 Tax=Hyphomicrobium sp. LHD-15 TaxID=3072142 RepID=UPI00281086E7|nr:CDF family Co(II)/Ni(II) efflux transporter DmeF [Hyphomicrobium sp. LHD-15]MDQ8699229.1 CDF family Co(II)/Ni(II) efflux transporter DmeF [Hyphomicrobium sp. LHD-15]
MHTQSLGVWQHSHVFLGERHARNERRVWLVVGLTTVMMVAEIVGGALFGSVALSADGWHMATHAAALTISGLAYVFARRHAHNPRYTFGTGKFGELAGYTSAIVLGLVSIGIVYEAIARIFDPVAIQFNEALAIAGIGLGVNLLSAWLLGAHDHSHGGHDHDDEHDHHDHVHGHASDGNLRAAFVHVIADAVTSGLAIGALLAASVFGWNWIDPLVGIIGAVLIATWAIALMRSTSSVLLDVLPSADIAADIRGRLEVNGDRVSDLHLWQLGPGHIGAIISIVTDDPRPPEHYKKFLSPVRGLSHVTVEVLRCHSHD